MAAKKKAAKGRQGALFKLAQPKQPQRRPFKPFVAAPDPPVGTYDPALDAALDATRRGFDNLTEDKTTAGLRSKNDYNVARGNLTRQRDEGLADYGSQLSDLRLRYDRLGQVQVQQARAAGVARGGALLQASRKRGENQAHDQQPIETAQQRLREGTDRGLGALLVDYGRGVDDRRTDLTRAETELGAQGHDTRIAKWFQAKNSGLPLPAAPSNEHTKGGLIYHVAGAAKPPSQRTYALPSGQTFSRKQWVGYLGKRKKSGAAPMLYG